MAHTVRRPAWKDQADAWSLFMRECRLGHLDEARTLLAQHPQLNVNDPIRPGPLRNMLHWCCEGGRTELVAFFLGLPQLDPNEGQCHETPLMIACCWGHAPAARLLLGDPRVDPNLVARDGGTALTMAILMDRLDMVRLLLQHPRLDPGVANDNRSTPLQYSTTRIRPGAPLTETSFWLLLQDPRLDLAREPNILYYACRYGGGMAVAALLRDPRLEVELASTPGHPVWTSVHGSHHESLLALLRSPRTLACLQDPHHGSTPLVEACLAGHLRSVQMLLASGKDLAHHSRYLGLTAREISIQRGFGSIATLLEEHSSHPREVIKRARRALGWSTSAAQLLVLIFVYPFSSS